MVTFCILKHFRLEDENLEYLVWISEEELWIKMSNQKLNPILHPISFYSSTYKDYWQLKQEADVQKITKFSFKLPSTSPLQLLRSK